MPGFLQQNMTLSYTTPGRRLVPPKTRTLRQEVLVRVARFLHGCGVGCSNFQPGSLGNLTQQML